MLLKVGTQVSNALKITLTKFHQHLSTGSQVFKDWDKQQQQRRLTTQSVLCYSPRRQLIVEDKNCATNGPTPLTGATNPNIENQRKHVIRDRILAIKFTGLLIVKMTDTSVDFHPAPWILGTARTIFGLLQVSLQFGIVLLCKNQDPTIKKYFIWHFLKKS